MLGKHLRPLDQRRLRKDQIAVQQIRDRPDGAFFQQLRRCRHGNFFIADRAYFVAGPFGHSVADVHVDLVATEVQRLVGAREVELDAGMTLAKLLQARHQPQ